MPIPFPMPNVTQPVELFQYVQNDLVGGIFGVAILISIFVITFLSVRSDETRALPAALFLTTISSLLLSILGLVAPQYVAGLAALTALSIFLIKD